jgi:hypothetical protein
LISPTRNKNRYLHRHFGSANICHQPIDNALLRHNEEEGRFVVGQGRDLGCLGLPNNSGFMEFP